MGVHVVREQAFDWSDELSVETVDQYGLENCSFEEDVSFPCRRVRRLLDRGGRGCRLLAFSFDTGWTCWCGRAARLRRGRRIRLACHRTLGCNIGLASLGFERLGLIESGPAQLEEAFKELHPHFVTTDRRAGNALPAGSFDSSVRYWKRTVKRIAVFCAPFESDIRCCPVSKCQMRWSIAVCCGSGAAPSRRFCCTRALWAASCSF